MNCEFLGSRLVLANQLHRVWCRECRAARSADAVLRRGARRLAAEDGPTEGIAAAIAVFGAAAPTRRVHKSIWTGLMNIRFLPAGILTAATALAAGAYAYSIDQPPQVPVPTIAAPSPNAFDVLARAAVAIPRVDRLRPASFLSAPLTRGPNRVAIAMIDAPAPEQKVIQSDDSRLRSPAQRKELLGEYTEALALTRKALSLRYLSPPVRGLNPDTGYIVDEQQLYEALRLEARVYEESGNPAAAVNSSLDAVELAALTAHGSTFHHRLSGFSQAERARMVVWRLGERLNGPQARSAAQRMERILRLQVPYSATLIEEKWAGLSAVQQLLEMDHWREMLYSGGESNATDGDFTRAAGYITLLPFSKQRIVDDYVRYMNSLLETPYKGTPLEFDSRNSNGAASAARDPMVARMAPAIPPRFQIQAGEETQNALLTAAFAIRAYELEHGARPAALRDLVPRYLASVPTDPFSGATLRYMPDRAASLHPLSGHFVEPVYSVGPDRNDDHCHSIWSNVARPNTDYRNFLVGKPQQRYLVDPNSVGDIVAGVNIE